MCVWGGGGAGRGGGGATDQLPNPSPLKSSHIELIQHDCDELHSYKENMNSMAVETLGLDCLTGVT